MKNFELHCPVDGTVALQPKLTGRCAGAGAIIVFPGKHVPSQKTPMGQRLSLVAIAYDRIAESELIRSVRQGSLHGQSYDRIKPWQAALAGVVFSAASFASLFFSL